MRPRKARRLMTLVGLATIAAAPFVGGIARADGHLSDTEALWVGTFGDPVVCSTLDEYPSVSGAYGVLAAVTSQGFRGDNAADIVNASVAIYCPEYGPVLDLAGRLARGESQSVIA